MEKCSFFIEDKAMFGCFPTQETVNALESKGVNVFVNLTRGNERFTVPYKTNQRYLHYPIHDHSVPYDWKSFAQFILEVCEIIKHNTGLVYIHCRAGVSRSSTVASIILAHLYNLSPDDAMEKIVSCHLNRKLKEKYRVKPPYQSRQKDFVYKFFRHLRYCNQDLDFRNSFSHYLNNFTDYPVTVPNVGTFPNAHFAFLAHKDLENVEYIRKLEHGLYDKSLLTGFDRCIWRHFRIQYMNRVLEYKFQQHPQLRHVLMNTGLRPLVKLSKNSFWGVGLDGKGKNMHGRLLTILRNNFLKNDLEWQRESWNTKYTTERSGKTEGTEENVGKDGSKSIFLQRFPRDTITS